MKQCDLSRLLENSAEKFYWLGFLMADGHFSTKHRLKICLAEKDLDHLVKLKEFLKITSPVRVYSINNRKYCEISAMDTKILTKVMQLFKISSRKTTEPCSLSKLTEEQLFCVSIGFIDGDGSILKVHKRNDAQITIKCHSNWFTNLQLLYPDAKIKYDTHGYAKASLTNSEVIRQYKMRATNLSLPLMKRKWDNIDLDFISRQQKTKENLPVIVEMIYNGFTQKQICNKLGYTKSALSNLLRRKGLR